MRTCSALLFIATAALVTVEARRAEACSAPSCYPGSFVPTEGAVVPANLPALYWQPTYGQDVEADPGRVTLVATDAPGTPIPLTATRTARGDYLLVPDVALVAGRTYTLTDATRCEIGDQTGPSVTFAVAPAAPLPTQLGTLAVAAEVQAPAWLATVEGTCNTRAIVASASITLVRSPDAEPWRDVLHFETQVDGAAWHPRASITSGVAPGASWRGRGRDLVYTICESGPQRASVDLASGEHQVTMRATLPGTTLALTTDATRVALACEPIPPSCDGGPCASAPDPEGSAGSGGCAASRPGAPVWLALVLAAPLLRFRRRYWQSGSPGSHGTTTRV